VAVSILLRPAPTEHHSIRADEDVYAVAILPKLANSHEVKTAWLAEFLNYTTANGRGELLALLFLQSLLLILFLPGDFSSSARSSSEATEVLRLSGETIPSLCTRTRGSLPPYQPRSVAARARFALRPRHSAARCCTWLVARCESAGPVSCRPDHCWRCFTPTSIPFGSASGAAVACFGFADASAWSFAQTLS
jgi:hypothetical protein